MSVPWKALRTASFTLVSLLILTACLALGANDANASILTELNQLVAGVESGAIDPANVQMNKHRVQYSITIPVRGAKERKQVRYARLRMLLQGDRRDVYRTEGWPTSRRREDYAGVITEHWIYSDKHRTYIFEGDRLVKTQRD